MGSRIALFYSANNHINESVVRSKISEVLSEYHQPQFMFKFNGLPKTKSGKIMRRVMRGLAADCYLDSSADYSTFINRNDFIKDYSDFLEFWLQRTIIPSPNMFFDLDKFCLEMQLKHAQHLMLPTLVVALLQTIEDWRMAISAPTNLHITLKCLNGKMYCCAFDIDDKKNILLLSKEISDSALRAESCLYDTSILLLSFTHEFDTSIQVSLIREMNTSRFTTGVKINFFFQTPLNIRSLLPCLIQ